MSDLGGVKSACKDPSFAQILVIFENQMLQLPELPFQTFTYMFYKLPLQIQTIEGALYYKIAPDIPQQVSKQIIQAKNKPKMTLRSFPGSFDLTFEQCDSTKGQLILKCLFDIFNSSKKRTKKLLWYLKSNCFRLFFQKNWRHHKDISKLTDL